MAGGRGCRRAVMIGLIAARARGGRNVDRFAAAAVAVVTMGKIFAAYAYMARARQ